MPNVFVVSNGGHDFSKAKQFGPLIFLSSGTVNKFHITEMAREFAAILSISEPEDYLVLNGPTVMSCVACSIMAQLHGKLNLLLWKKGQDNNLDHYERRTLDLNALIGGPNASTT
jgi:hypothetical protein